MLSVSYVVAITDDHRRHSYCHVCCIMLLTVATLAITDAAAVVDDYVDCYVVSCRCRRRCGWCRCRTSSLSPMQRAVTIAVVVVAHALDSFNPHVMTADAALSAT
jgi:hypothetical protein